MSKTISFKGQLAMGTQDIINLKTNNGKTGYKITKFQVMPTLPGVHDNELLGKIYSTDQTGNVTDTVDFSEGELMAATFQKTESSGDGGSTFETVIFDNAQTNQNIFVYISDIGARSDPANYYIELERMKISDVEATKLTLQSIRNVIS